MTCDEWQASLAETEDFSRLERSSDWQAHIKSCPACAALAGELALIVSAAAQLRSLDEPSPRVWNSIEIALRQEGMIRPQRANHSLLPSLQTPSWVRWMLPVAALLLLSVTLYLRRHVGTEQAANVAPAASANQQDDFQLAGLKDDDLIQEVAQQPAAVQAQYSDNLRRVNEYIQDARNVVSANPNDGEARRSLMEAYQQKAMLFELALDRSMNDQTMR